MRYLKLFEDFKQKNITIDDVVRCINNGGVIYATIVKDLPDNNPDLPLNPLSIDEDGTVTIEFDGKNYEVELKHVDKIDWNPINEALQVSSTVDGVLRYLREKKNDKIAKLLSHVTNSDYYNDDETLNYIGTTLQDNMVSYLATNKRVKDWELNFSSNQRTTIRIGRAIRKICDAVNKYLNYQVDTEVRIVRENPRSWGSIKIEDPYIIDIPTSEMLPFIYLYEDSQGNLRPQSKAKIIGEDFQIEGTLIETQSYWSGIQTLIVDDTIKSEKVFPTVSSHWIVRERNKYEIDIPVKIELTNDLEITDSDIEKFVNEFISFVKMSRSDETSSIKEVNGEEIKKWYNRENYQSELGKLGGSCMSHADCQEFLDIYTENKNVVSLLILSNKGGKLVGRALLWKLDDGRTFMDRVYTASDSDDNIFYNYAIDKGYIYRTVSAGSFKYMKDGSEIDPGKIEVSINNEYDYYPYMDTLSYLYKGVLSNVSSRGCRTLKDTEGKWSEYYNQDEDEDYDND